MQQLISTSSTQSEIRALQSFVVDIIFIVEFCMELRHPAIIFEDNKAVIFKDNGAVIALSREMTSPAKRCKHFLMAISWIREHVEAGLIQLQQIPDVDNRADILTKIITGMEFRRKAEDSLGSEIDTAMGVDKTVRDD